MEAKVVGGEFVFVTEREFDLRYYKVCRYNNVSYFNVAPNVFIAISRKACARRTLIKNSG
jgi:hypothetical protein